MSTPEQQAANNAAQGPSLKQPYDNLQNQRQAVPQPTEDQLDLMAAHGTLSAILMTAAFIEDDKLSDLLLGGIQAVVKQLDETIQFKAAHHDVLKGAAYLLEGV